MNKIHWKKGMIKPLPDWEELVRAVDKLPIKKQLEEYLKWLNEFEDNEASIEKIKSEELELIEDWEFGAKCQAKINGIKRLIEYNIAGYTACDNVDINMSKYLGIAEALKEYIKGASDNDLEHIIISKALPLGASKKEWIKSNADACRFADRINMTFSEWNKCFLLPSRKKLKHNMRSKIKLLVADGKCELLNILARFE